MKSTLLSGLLLAAAGGATALAGCTPVSTTAGMLDGATALDGASAPDGGGPDAATPRGPVYAFTGSSDGKIRAFLVDIAAATLTPKGATTAGANPSFLAVDTQNRRVFAVDENNSEVLAFGFDPQTAAFTPRGKQATLGAGPAHVAVTPNGSSVLVANYGGGSVTVFPVLGDGTLGAASDTKTPGSKAHLAITSADGAYAFVPCLGANLVAQYVFAGGKLTANSPASVSPPAAAGPRHLAFHPSQKWAFGINETASSMTSYAYGVSSGTLAVRGTMSTLPAGTTTANTGAEVVVHPGGSFVYGSNRGLDTIAIFAVDQATGGLTLSGNVPTGGQVPRSFSLDDTGTLMVVANQHTAATPTLGNLTVFRVDTAGKPNPIGTPLTGVDAPAFVGLFSF